MIVLFCIISLVLFISFLSLYLPISWTIFCGTSKGMGKAAGGNGNKKEPSITNVTFWTFLNESKIFLTCLTFLENAKLISTSSCKMYQVVVQSKVDRQYYKHFAIVIYVCKIEMITFYDTGISRPLFYLFSSFSHQNSMTKWKAQMLCLRFDVWLGRLSKLLWLRLQNFCFNESSMDAFSNSQCQETSF